MLWVGGNYNRSESNLNKYKKTQAERDHSINSESRWIFEKLL